MRHWNWLPRKAVDDPSLAMLKIRMPWTSWSRGWHPCPSKEDGPWWCKTLFQSKQFYDSREGIWTYNSRVTSDSPLNSRWPPALTPGLKFIAKPHVSCLLPLVPCSFRYLNLTLHVISAWHRKGFWEYEGVLSACTELTAFNYEVSSNTGWGSTWIGILHPRLPASVEE